MVLIQGSLKLDAYVKIPVAANKSFISVGDGAELVNGGFKLINVSNVIFRNFTIRDSYIPGDWDGKTADHDGIQLDASHHVWVDHMAFERLGDGMIDTRKDSDFLTYSWNVFADHNKALGVGWTDNAVTHMTLHHNWIRNTTQRNASLDNTAAAHVYNNYLENIGQYGMMGRNAAKVVVEGNYFDSVADPIVAKDPATQVVNRDNVFNGTYGRKDNVGAAFEPSSFYQYSKDATADVPRIVSAGAGPLEPSEKVADNLVVSGATHVWLDHLTLDDGETEDAEQPEYFGEPFLRHDGLLDVVRQADLVTISWSRMEGHDKSLLWGNGDGAILDRGKLRVTLHHNELVDLEQRAPRVRFGQAHVYNNVYRLILPR